MNFDTKVSFVKFLISSSPYVRPLYWLGSAIFSIGSAFAEIWKYWMEEEETGIILNGRHYYNPDDNFKDPLNFWGHFNKH